MGGFIASSAFIRNPEIDAMININGSSAWMVSEEEFQKNGSTPYPFIEEIKRFDPIESIGLLGNRHVLLLHGEHDKVINPLGQETFYQVANNSGNIPDNITLKLYPFVNHTITLSMIETIIQWLNDKFEKKI